VETADASWPLRFVREVARWSIAVAFVIAVGGAVVLRDWRFPLALTLGAAFDVGSVMALLQRVGPPALDAARAGKLAALLIAPRLVIKALLVAAAVLLPFALDKWGMLAGILVFDVTLMTVGSVIAASRVMRTTWT
jgi:hypothetical protein